MKKSIYLFSLILFSVFLSCGDSTKTSSETKKVVDENIIVSDLSQYDLPLTITSEKSWDQSGSIEELSVSHEPDDIEWDITIGERFNILIEDWGDEAKNAKQEIERKSELEQVLSYEFIREESSFVTYSVSIPGETQEKPDFHFFKVVKIGEDQYYTVMSNPMEKYTEEEINKMVDASNTLQESVQLAEEI